MLKINLQRFGEEIDNDVELPEEDIIPLDDDAILPDDDAAEPQVENQDNQPNGEDTKPPEEAKEEPKEPYKFKVKFNHEEMEIAEPDAIPLIQKGLNYDKLQERYNAIQNDPRLSKYEKVEKISKLLGYQTDDQLIEALYNLHYQTVANQRGLTPEQVRKEIELQEKEAQIKAKEKAEQEKEKADQEKKQREAMYERFLERFPDVKPEDIKLETWEKVKNGMDLIAAYIEQRNQDLETQLKLIKQKEKNKSTAPVGGVTNHGSIDPTAEDDFLAGFNSEF